MLQGLTESLTNENLFAFTIKLIMYFIHSMRATLTKIGEGAFVDVFGCQNEEWERLAIKVKRHKNTVSRAT